MATAAFVLLMLWGGNSSQSGIAVVQQEFSTYENCETARAALAKAHDRTGGLSLRSHGCYRK